jgi:hypothetical protein
MPRLVQRTCKLATLSVVQPALYRIEFSSECSARWQLVKACTWIAASYWMALETRITIDSSTSDISLDKSVRVSR